jgi:hypothetical protein
MKTMAALMALLLAAPAQAQTAKPGHAVTTMPIDGWFSLAPAGSGLIRKFDATPGAEDTENITVYGRRGRDLEAEWRAAERASEPQYEARNSAAAQPLYGGQAEWASPEQQHIMSDAKESMGLCGALGGLVTCPNK